MNLPICTINIGPSTVLNFVAKKQPPIRNTAYTGTIVQTKGNHRTNTKRSHPPPHTHLSTPIILISTIRNRILKSRTMKFSFGLLATVFSGAAAASAGSTNSLPVGSAITADSEIGMKVLSQARRLEQNGEEDITWVAGYSLKFQGCHHISQWNDYAEDEEDVKIATRRLIRFRLCPSSSCSASKAAGCTSGYGDYIVDMATFVDAYYEAKRRSIENDCENYLTYQCDCEDDDGKGDDFNREYCEYDCFSAAGKTDCIDRNPYEDDQQNQEEFRAEEYLECAAYEPPANDNNGRRKLEDGEENQAEYYIGPYCAEQGGAVYLGFFSDDSCTEFYDENAGATTYKELSGESLPYHSTSIVGMDCIDCLEQEDANGNDDGAADADNTNEQCEALYKAAGKCESNLPSGMVDEANENACKYLEGVKVTRMDGIVDVTASKKNNVVTAFIVIFAMAFAALGFYVWYLRTRLGVKKNALL